MGNETRRPIHAAEEEDDDSVAIIENAMKQVAFASNRDRELATTPSVLPRKAVAAATTRDVQLRVVDTSGGPDFKAQTDSRIGNHSVVQRALPAHADQTADFYGQAAHVHRERVEEMEEPMAMVTAAAVATIAAPRLEGVRGSASQRKRPERCRDRTSASSQPPHSSHKPKSQSRAEKRFWLTVISTGVIMNMLLVSGLMVVWLYFTGVFADESAQPLQEPVVVLAPTLSPTAALIVPNSAPVTVRPVPNVTFTTSSWTNTTPISGAAVNVADTDNAPLAEAGRADVVGPMTGTNASSIEPTDESSDATTSPPIQRRQQQQLLIPIAISVGAVLLEFALVTLFCFVYRKWKAEQRDVVVEDTIPVPEDDTC